MNNNRILHVLAANPDGSSALIINGEREENSTPYMAEIVGLEAKVSKSPIPWGGYAAGYSFVKGYLQNNGTNGKPMSFSYCVKGAILAEAKQLLIQDLSNNGYSLDEATTKCLESKKSNTLVIIGLIALIIILFALLFSHCTSERLSQNVSCPSGSALMTQTEYID